MTTAKVLAFGILRDLVGVLIGLALFAAILVLIGLVLGPIRLFLEFYVMPDALSDKTLFGIILAGFAVVVFIVIKRIFWPMKPVPPPTLISWPDEDEHDPR